MKSVNVKIGRLAEKITRHEYRSYQPACLGMTYREVAHHFAFRGCESARDTDRIVTPAKAMKRMIRRVHTRIEDFIGPGENARHKSAGVGYLCPLDKLRRRQERSTSLEAIVHFYAREVTCRAEIEMFVHFAMQTPGTGPRKFESQLHHQSRSAAK